MWKVQVNLEADTVAHCGEPMAGDFVWSVTLTDVHTQWTEKRAPWNRGQHAVRERIAEVESGLPFEILALTATTAGNRSEAKIASQRLPGGRR